MPARLSRRRLLQTFGLGAVCGLAGCSSDSQERTATTTATRTPVEPQRTAGDLPPYADFVPDTTDAVLCTTFDLQVESGHQVGSPPERVRDPLRYSAMSAATVGSLLRLGVVGSGLGLPGPEFGFDPVRLGTTEIARALTVDAVGVLELPVDLSGAIADARDGPGAVEFEADDRALVANEAGTVAGLTTDAVVFQPPTVDASSPDLVRDVVDTRAGARPPKHESDDAFASLLANADAAGSVACGYAPETTLGALQSETASSSPVSVPTGEFGAATGAVVQIDLDNGTPPQPGSAVMRFPDDASLDLVAATESVGSAAADRSVAIDGGTVRVAGTYSWDALSEFEGSPLEAL